MMRPMIIAVPPEAPSNLASAFNGSSVTLTWNDNSGDGDRLRGPAGQRRPVHVQPDHVHRGQSIGRRPDLHRYDLQRGESSLSRQGRRLERRRRCRARLSELGRQLGLFQHRGTAHRRHDAQLDKSKYRLPGGPDLVVLSGRRSDRLHDPESDGLQLYA